VYIRYFWQGNHQIYGHIRCMYTVLANPTYVACNKPALLWSYFEQVGLTWCSTQTHTNTHTHAGTHRQTRTHNNTHTHTDTQTDTHTTTHTHTHTDTHTHAHTHIFPCFCHTGTARPHVKAVLFQSLSATTCAYGCGATSVL
jgi:hypothetical protein